MASHNELGRIGEEMAIAFLKNKGYIILDVNYKIKKLELDIIAKDGDELVIVEVKTRTDNEVIDPLEAVTKKKQRNIIAAAHHYITERQLDLNTRFDIISVLINQQEQIEHIPAAFYPLLKR
jgi:putative endonuclease